MRLRIPLEIFQFGCRFIATAVCVSTSTCECDCFNTFHVEVQLLEKNARLPIKWIPHMKNRINSGCQMEGNYITLHYIKTNRSKEKEWLWFWNSLLPCYLYNWIFLCVCNLSCVAMVKCDFKRCSCFCKCAIRFMIRELYNYQLENN